MIHGNKKIYNLIDLIRTYCDKNSIIYDVNVNFDDKFIIFEYYDLLPNPDKKGNANIQSQ